MALVKCRECGGAISTSAKTCPHCGSPLAASSRASYLWLIIGLPVGAIVLFLGFGAISGSPEKSQARSAIDLCWESADDALAPMSARHLARSTCQKMVSDFEQKHGYAPSLRRN
jgi:hypothetical protein